MDPTASRLATAWAAFADVQPGGPTCAEMNDELVAAQAARIANLEGALQDIVGASRDDGLAEMVNYMRNRACSVLL